MKRCFCIHESDNVATVLDESVEAQAELEVIRPLTRFVIRSLESIALGHKVALFDIPCGEPIVKYGVAIGVAIDNIQCGRWVHLHNCCSRVDQRSGSLDLHTGSSQDVMYE